MCGGNASVSFGGAQGMEMLSGMFSSIAQVQQQNAAADAQRAQIEAQKRQMDAQYEMLVAEAIQKMQQASLAEVQAGEAAAMSKMETAREALRARELAKASASAAGVGGNTLNRIVADISFTEQQKKAVAEAERRNIVNDQQIQKQNAILSTKMTPMYYTEPEDGNYFNSMFSVLPGLLGGFSFSCGTTAPSSPCGVKAPGR